MALADDLERIDTTLRQLQQKWEMFFGGVERKPPVELQASIEALIKRYAGVEIRNNGERFRYQGLTARYTAFSELWQKRLRAREEGRVFGMHGLRAEQVPPPSASRVAAAPQAPAEFRVSDARKDTASVRALYETFVDQKRRAGETSAPSFESFHQLINQQTERLRGERGARAVDFRLETKDGKVSLKARLVK